MDRDRETDTDVVGKDSKVEMVVGTCVSWGAGAWSMNTYFLAKASANCSV